MHASALRNTPHGWTPAWIMLHFAKIMRQHAEYCFNHKGKCGYRLFCREPVKTALSDRGNTAKVFRVKGACWIPRSNPDSRLLLYSLHRIRRYE